MSQFELVFDNNPREFEQVWSYVQKLLTNPTSQERISQVDEMEKVFERSFQEIRTSADSISRSLLLPSVVQFDSHRSQMLENQRPPARSKHSNANNNQVLKMSSFFCLLCLLAPRSHPPPHPPHHPHPPHPPYPRRPSHPPHPAHPPPRPHPPHPRR